jgi:hypothetical protein
MRSVCHCESATQGTSGGPRSGHVRSWPKPDCDTAADRPHEHGIDNAAGCCIENAQLCKIRKQCSANIFRFSLDCVIFLFRQNMPAPWNESRSLLHENRACFVA